MLIEGWVAVSSPQLFRAPGCWALDERMLCRQKQANGTKMQESMTEAHLEREREMKIRWLGAPGWLRRWNFWLSIVARFLNLGSLRLGPATCSHWRGVCLRLSLSSFPSASPLPAPAHAHPLSVCLLTTPTTEVYALVLHPQLLSVSVLHKQEA